MRDLQALADTVRNAREAKGLTQVGLADRARVGRGWLSQVELGRVLKPGIERLQAIALVLNIDSRQLLRMAGHPVDVLPPVKKRTLADMLQELAIEARRMQERADRGDDEAQAQIIHTAERFAFALAKPLIHARELVRS